MSAAARREDEHPPTTIATVAAMTSPAPAPLASAVLDTLFRHARTQNGWLPRPVSEASLRELYDLWRWGPTAANGQPARVVFVMTPEGKARLRPCLSPGNVDKTMGAPVTAVIGYDVGFHEHLPRLFPHSPSARDGFVGEHNIPRAEASAFRNGTLQGAYLMIAARALGLDCGPMSGFDHAAVDREFFAGTSIRSNFLCNLGYGDPTKLFGRLPRLSFEECCRVV